MSDNTLTFVATVTDNVDTHPLRGSAPLCDLARISRADIFDQVTNPKGLQRDLSRRHALDVYDYLAGEHDHKKTPRALPEVVLNVRDKKVCTVETLTEGAGFRVVEVTFDLDAIDHARTAKVSRIDGNHRLMFANGDGKDREPIDVMAPFQLHIGLKPDQEAGLFVDMNANHKSLNTSHLAVLRSRLTAAEHELVTHPARVYARRLAEDEGSPFYGRIYMGGSKAGAKGQGTKYPLTFTGLEGAISRMLKGSTWLQELRDHDMVYALIRNYWLAVAQVWGEDFGDPDTLLMKSIGVNSLAQLAPKILDRIYTTSGEGDPLSIAALLGETHDVYDWHKDAGPDGVGGMSGNRAVLIIAGAMAEALPTIKRDDTAPGFDVEVPDAVVVG